MLLALIGKAFGTDPESVLEWSPRRLGRAVDCLAALEAFEARHRPEKSQPVFIVGAFSG